MLSYLVTSRTRRNLLRLLWRDGVEDTASGLARRASLSFAATHRELDAMVAAGVAHSERVGTGRVYRRAESHPRAQLLRQLVADDEQTAASNEPDDDTRGWLTLLGAPLVTPPARRAPPTVEEILAKALSLSHRDATLARVLPVVLWKQRQQVDWERLVGEVTRRDERHALGFFLQLAGTLGKDRKLVARARALRDRRRRVTRPFFAGKQGRHALAAARRNSPALAKRWGYLMNLGMDSFTEAFAKHTST